MSRILVTGSADGLGRAAADTLLSQGHEVVVHARNPGRAADLSDLVDRGAHVVVGDFADRDAVRAIASELADAAPLDAVVHNAGVWSGRAVMPVNVVAPYLLTALLPGPRRLVYLSSSSHFSGRPVLDGVDWSGRTPGSYGDSKLFVTALAAAVARLRPGIPSNAVDPGWVPTRMGGRARRTISSWATAPRSGWPPATARKRSPPAATGTTRRVRSRTRRFTTRPSRTGS